MQVSRGLSGPPAQREDGAGERYMISEPDVAQSLRDKQRKLSSNSIDAARWSDAAQGEDRIRPVYLGQLCDVQTRPSLTPCVLRRTGFTAPGRAPRSRSLGSSNKVSRSASRRQRRRRAKLASDELGRHGTVDSSCPDTRSLSSPRRDHEKGTASTTEHVEASDVEN